MNERFTVYTDGSCINNRNVNTKAGSGVWYGQNNARDAGLRVPETLAQTNQVGEVMAVLYVATTAVNFAPMHVISDSKYTIHGMTKYLKDYEDRGWIGVANANILRPTAYRLRKRSTCTIFEWVKGHSGVEGNERSDKMANEGARMERGANIDLTIPDK